MINDYIYNIGNVMSNILFQCFIGGLIIITIILIISLIMLIVGCLLKSQTIRSKFMKIVPVTIFLLIIILSIPKLYIRIINVI